MMEKIKEDSKREAIKVNVVSYLEKKLRWERFVWKTRQEKQESVNRLDGSID
jgi:hypothetical protein